MFTVLISYSSSTCSWNYATNCNFFFWFSLITSGSALLNRPSGRNIGLVSNRDQARQKKSCRRSRKCKNHFLKTETNSFLLFGKTPEIFFPRSFSVRNRTGQKKKFQPKFRRKPVENRIGFKTKWGPSSWPRAQINFGIAGISEIETVFKTRRKKNSSQHFDEVRFSYQ